MPQKLVVGIDYGTSNSGAAYALFDSDSDGQPDIEVIRKWPHGSLRRDASEKVPSEIAYDDSGRAVGYGFEIPEGKEALQWVKLLLEPEHFSGAHKTPNTERVWRTYDELERLGKRPVDVIADYLSWLWTRTQDTIVKAESDPEIFQTAEVTVVLTVPASWSDRAKDCMLQASQKSGIDGNRRRLKFRAEPEAAAVLEMKVRAKKGQVDTGDCVIICDGGGGTVDVATYQVRTRRPLSVDQVVMSKGDFCGSAFIDSEFECQLRSILGRDYDRLSSAAIAGIRDHFEYNIKRSYNPEEPKAYSIPVPSLEDDARRSIKNGKLSLDDAMLRASFDSIMTQIMSLIDWQKDELRAKGLEDKLKGILLVGGFGGSEYLHVRIRQEYPEEEGIKVWRGDHSWTAVVQDAVACEASHRTNHCAVNMRISSFNYGIAYREGTVRRVQWLVRKGQAIQSHTQTEPFVLRLDDQPWLDEDQNVILLVSLVKTEDDSVSDELDTSTKPHVEISCRVPTAIRHSPEAHLVQQNPKAWQIPAELVLGMDGPVLSVRCRIQGKDVGAAELKYHDDTNNLASRRESTASSLNIQPKQSLDARDSVLSTNAVTPVSSRASLGRSDPLTLDKLDSGLSMGSLLAFSTIPPDEGSQERRQSKGKSPSPGGEAARSSSWYSIRTRRDKPSKEKKEKEQPKPKSEPLPAKDGTRRIYADGRIVKAPPSYPEHPGLA